MPSCGGTDDQAARRRTDDTPLLTKPLASEFGGVSPCIVVPGSWSKADYRYQAEHIVTSKLNNAGHNCIATQVLVLPQEWDGSDLLLGEIRELLGSLPPRRDLWGGVLLLGLVMSVATLATIDLYLPGGLIEGTQSLDNARTAGFTVLVLAQLFNALNARSETGTAFHRIFANAWLWAAIALSGVLQVAVVHAPFLRDAFTTAPLSLEQWLICLAMASTVLWVSEIRKLVLRHTGR